VYRALELDWDPRTCGALADRSPGLDKEKVMAAIIEAMSRRFELESWELPPSVIDEARGLIRDHLPQVA
jgi:hypothetical protein